MSLVQMTWTRVPIHVIALEFLRAELETNLAQLRTDNSKLMSDEDLAELLNNADLTNPLDNQLRLRLLYLMRCRYFGEIPPDTEWYEVHNLTDSDLGDLYVARHPVWTDPTDNNELLKVARRKTEPLRAPPTGWKRIILWGHDKDGPFTIIEGNHRLVGYAANRSGSLNIPVLVGLAATPCYWHPPDPTGILMADLWR